MLTYKVILVKIQFDIAFIMPKLIKLKEKCIYDSKEVI